MSIQIDVSVTGPQLAGCLLGDEEELAYAFKHFQEESEAAEIGRQIADHFAAGDCKEIAD